MPFEIITSWFLETLVERFHGWIYLLKDILEVRRLRLQDIGFVYFEKGLHHYHFRLLNRIFLNQFLKLSHRWNYFTYVLLDLPLIHNVLPRHLQSETEELKHFEGECCAKWHSVEIIIASFLESFMALFSNLL